MRRPKDMEKGEGIVDYISRKSKVERKYPKVKRKKEECQRCGLELWYESVRCPRCEMIR